MNTQEAFDKSATHLLTQKRQASVEADFGPNCKYRTESGLKCAVGCLIPDDMYIPEMEGRRVFALIRSYSFVAELFDGVNEEVLRSLQMIHDGSDPQTWKDRLADVAVKYSLDASVLEKS